MDVRLLVVLVFLLVVIAINLSYSTTSKFSFTEKRKPTSASEGCCAGNKKHAGCMCKNPKYFKYVGEQVDRVLEIKDLEGILIDARCYALTRDNYTNAHSFPPSKDKVAKGCATACAKSGVPVGLLIGNLPPGPDSEVYILLHPSPNLAEYMEKGAKVSGWYMKDMKAIFTTCVKIRDEKGEWKDIPFTTPMIGMSKNMEDRISKEEVKTSTEGLSSPTWEKDIKGLFRPVDIESMKNYGNIDLSSYEDVVKHAEGIYTRVADGSMPCDGAWDKSKVELLKRWIDGGKWRK